LLFFYLHLVVKLDALPLSVKLNFLFITLITTNISFLQLLSMHDSNPLLAKHPVCAIRDYYRAFIVLQFLLR